MSRGSVFAGQPFRYTHGTCMYLKDGVWCADKDGVFAWGESGSHPIHWECEPHLLPAAEATMWWLAR